MKELSTTLIAAVFFAFSLAQASLAQSLKIGDDGRIIGNPIHASESFVYFNCSDVVGESQFIDQMAMALTTMSEAFGVLPPQNSNCVLSQGKIGTLLQNFIAMDFFINDENAQCFYSNFCNDSRQAAFLPTASGLEMGLMVVSAEKSMTERWCLSASRGFLQQACRL